jgi:GNAT superfamily N-acetyltransferase
MGKTRFVNSNAASNVVETKKSKARATAAINEHIMVLRAALFTPQGRDKNVTEGIAPAFLKYDRNGVNVVISFASKLTKDELRWAFDECKLNMEDRYEESGYGWDDEDKKKEFTEEGTRFLIVRASPEEDDTPGDLLGFVHFRFSVQGDVVDRMAGVPCTFVWDMHLDESIQRKGLGRHLVMLLELISRREKMQMVCFPVQLYDEDTIAFLTAIRGYAPDISLKDTLDFEPELEGFNLYAKSLAPVARPAVALAPAVTTPAVASAESPVRESKAAPANVTSPQSVFEFPEIAAAVEAAAADQAEGAEEDAEDGENDAEQQEEEEGEDEELDLKTIDLHDAIHGLKVLYKEKHGHEPSDQVVDQWLESLKQMREGDNSADTTA